jgi:hypothetical protein
MNLDTMLEALRTRPEGGRLRQVEAEVWRRIDAKREQERGVWAWRTAMAAVVLSVGVVAGGGAAASVRGDLSPFAVHSALAPSTLLETGR